MKILRSKLLAKAGRGFRTFLSLHEVSYSHKDREQTYFTCVRGETIVPFDQKQPDAVVIVAVVKPTVDHPARLVITDEFRIPVGGREYGFPAGLIDPADIAGSTDIYEAAKKAAIREMHEETGLVFEPEFTSPRNLYSSAGMTNESVILVFGKASGDISNKNLEQDEDIEVLLKTQDELKEFIKQDLHWSKIAWPFMWHYSIQGF